MPKKQAANFQIIDGVKFPPNWHPYGCQLWLFRYAPKLQVDPYWRPEGTLDGNPSPTPYTGTGRHSHSRIITEIQRPSFEWHDWAIKADYEFCNNQRTAISGGGGSSKSYTAGDYGLKFWECCPPITAVVVASTSIEAARRRIWKSISAGYTEASRNVGRLGDSVPISSPRPAIRSSPKDFVHGIYVVPVEQGDIDKAVDAIKGFHARRMLIIRDESDAVSQAIIDVENNLRIGTEEFQTIDLGNLPSPLNPLGRQMELAPGQPITEAMGTEWISAKSVKCLRFDGENSPNIRDNGKWTGLMTEDDRADIERQAGGKNTRAYYVMVKGLPPPEGIDDTVVSEPLLYAHHAFDKVTWRSAYIVSASLDPSRGGDKCLFRTFKRGQDTDGKFRALLDEVIPIPVTTGDATNPPEYQIAAKVKDLCKSRGIVPEEFIAGTTGIGAGVGATLQREWSPHVHLVEEGGAPSDRPMSDEDPRPANEVCDRKVTELWMRIREFIQADIVRGMDTTTAIQLCQRRWDYKGKKKSIQKKDELPSSPDEADALGFYVELLCRKGINASVQTPAKHQSNATLDRELRENDFDSRDDAYSDEVGAEEAAFF